MTYGGYIKRKRIHEENKFTKKTKSQKKRIYEETKSRSERIHREKEFTKKTNSEKTNSQGKRIHRANVGFNHCVNEKYW